MRNFLFCLVVSLIVTAAAMGQGLNVAESPKKPGDPLRYTIILDSPVKGNVNVIYVSMALTTDPRGDQKGLASNFELSKFKKVSPTEYEIDDVVPLVMSGTYLLNSIQFRTTEGAIGNYSYQKDFKQANSIRVESGGKTFSQTSSLLALLRSDRVRM
jgi:hypothetical protein